jgi:type I restriction enzyme S subunit
MSSPSLPMKDSGIDWLGKVPAHWDVKPVKSLIHSIEQGWSPQCEGYPADDGDWGVLKVGCVNGGRFDPDENKALPVNLEPIPSLGIAKGDILISRANTRELVGSAAVVEDNYPQLMLCDKLYRLKAILEVSACRVSWRSISELARFEAKSNWLRRELAVQC